MPKKPYVLIEHTADIRIRVKAKNQKELFIQAAKAMFDLIAEKKLSALSSQLSAKEVKIIQKAGNIEELLVNWLNELLSLSAVKELIFSGFKINKLDDNLIEAVATGRNFKDYQINSEIKAATYHQLRVVKTASGYTAEVIFDV